MEEEREVVVVTPGEVLGKASDLKAGRGAYVSPHNHTLYASLTGFRRTLSPPSHSPDQVLLLFYFFMAFGLSCCLVPQNIQPNLNLH